MLKWLFTIKNNLQPFDVVVIQLGPKGENQQLCFMVRAFISNLNWQIVMLNACYTTTSFLSMLFMKSNI